MTPKPSSVQDLEPEPKNKFSFKGAYGRLKQPHLSYIVRAYLFTIKEEMTSQPRHAFEYIGLQASPCPVQTKRSYTTQTKL